MEEKKSFTVQSLISCLIFNAVLLAAVYLAAVQGFQLLHQQIGPVSGKEAEPVLEDMHLALSKTNDLIEQTEPYLAPVIFGAGGLITLLLWLTIQFQGRRLMDRITQSAVPPSEETPKKAKKKSASESRPSPAPAVQMLSILQRQGRFIDFLQEDLSVYEDPQIGAAVRTIHEGCKKALAEHVSLKPVFETEGEGEAVTIQSGFDAHSIRLTGNVKGDPPFQGTLRHRGWKVTRVDLPLQVSVQEKDWILAPAEVEV